MIWARAIPRITARSVRGLRCEVAETLYLNEHDTETLRFLVHRHLMLSHLAFRRDTSDESIVLEHAAEIGSPAVLRMLFVLTCADLAAVGPGVLNQWKLEVLTRTLHADDGPSERRHVVDGPGTFGQPSAPNRLLPGTHRADPLARATNRQRYLPPIWKVRPTDDPGRS